MSDDSSDSFLLITLESSDPFQKYVFYLTESVLNLTSLNISSAFYKFSSQVGNISDVIANLSDYLYLGPKS